MFELADSLLGVYKVDNMSYCIHFGVKKIVAELRRKIDRARNPLASQGQGNTGPSTKELQSQDVPASQVPPVQNNSPIAGTSKAAMLELMQQQQNRTRKFPRIDLSAIIDEDVQVDVEEEEEDGEEENHSHLPKSPTVIEKTVLEQQKENSFTPPGRVSDAPSAAAEEALGSADMFEDMDADADVASIPPKRSSLPKFTSTPFVGRRPAHATRNQGGGFINDSDEEGGVIGPTDVSPEISPIKGNPPVVPFTPAPAGGGGGDDEEDSFKSARDSQDSDVDEIGPSQEWAS